MTTPAATPVPASSGGAIGAPARYVYHGEILPPDDSRVSRITLSGPVQSGALSRLPRRIAERPLIIDWEAVPDAWIIAATQHRNQ